MWIAETRFEGDVAFARLEGAVAYWITAVRMGTEYYICVPGHGAHLIAADSLTDALHYCVELLGANVPLTEACER